MLDQLPIFSDQLNVQPLKNYPGKKAASGVCQQILSQIPKCELFIDAMCGSGYVSSQVKGCQRIVNDVDRSIIDKIRYTAENVTFFNLSYTAIVKKFSNSSPGRVFYFDPPYLLETRSYQQNIYRHDWNVNDHRRFLKIITAINNPVMVSHYPCKMYDKKLQGWRKITYNAMTRAGVREECLYMNYPQPVLLQCYQVVGTDFTDRQRIKRKVERLINRLNNEDPQERAAILSSIIDKFSYVIS